MPRYGSAPALSPLQHTLTHHPAPLYLQDAFGDCPTARTARQLSPQQDAFAYEWRWRSDCATTVAFFPPSWDVYHTSDMPFVFDPFANCSRTQEGKVLSSSWATFLDGLISRGSPDERWPPFAPAHPWRMVLGNFGKPLAPWLSLTNASYSANCAFWDQLSWSDDLL
uniref:Carboxylesterase type B domain-containing protein n=1 Tax=Haptolina brevifila TaxID=156173 RepID=A0A7S2D204_9EUKA|mmetsp:Transcript_31721/g.63347  ORF Transcript_31721/g.63347 Transcript_31721/m.63347 type:complete len:167 (+) Transcript_31721:108-608(+)